MKLSPKGYGGKRIQTHMITAVQDYDDQDREDSSEYNTQQTQEEMDIPTEQRSNYNYSKLGNNQAYSPSAGSN